jgi:hypothetical protein
MEAAAVTEDMEEAAAAVVTEDMEAAAVVTEDTGAAEAVVIMVMAAMGAILSIMMMAIKVAGIHWNYFHLILDILTTAKTSNKTCFSKTIKFRCYL